MSCINIIPQPKNEHNKNKNIKKCEFFRGTEYDGILKYLVFLKNQSIYRIWAKSYCLGNETCLFPCAWDQATCSGA